MTTRIPVDTAASPMAERLMATMNELSDNLVSVGRLRGIAESAAAPLAPSTDPNWANMAATFGVSEAQAQVLYNNLLNMDNLLNNEPASDFLRSVINQIAER